MLLLFLALIDQGDEIIMSNPHYACYPNFVTTAGGVPDFIYTNEDNGFMLQPDELAAHINPKTKAILINSPSNPTGQVLPADVLKGIAQVAGDVPIISDEIYQGLSMKARDHTILEYTDNAFVLNGFFKTLRHDRMETWLPDSTETVRQDFTEGAAESVHFHQCLCPVCGHRRLWKVRRSRLRKW